MACGRDESNIFFNNNDDDDGVIVREWMGPVAPTPANLLTNTRQFVTLTNSPIYQFANFATIIYKSCKKYCNSPPQTPKAPQGHKIFAQIACNFAKIKCKVCKIATFVAIVRYKIALYNANDFVQIVQIVCTNSCKFAN